MADLDAIRRTFNNYSAQIDSTTKQIANLNSRIDALKNAQRESERAHAEFEALATKVAKISVGSSWRGKRRNGYDKGKKTTVPNEARKYAYQVEGMASYIKNEIKRLEQERLGLQSSLFSLNKNVERLERAIKEETLASEIR